MACSYFQRIDKNTLIFVRGLQEYPPTPDLQHWIRKTNSMQENLALDENYKSEKIYNNTQ